MMENQIRGCINLCDQQKFNGVPIVGLLPFIETANGLVCYSPAQRWLVITGHARVAMLADGHRYLLSAMDAVWRTTSAACAATGVKQRTMEGYRMGKTLPYGVAYRIYNAIKEATHARSDD